MPNSFPVLKEIQTEPNTTRLNFDVYSTAHNADIRRLVSQDYYQPVISLYLNLTPDRLLRRPPVYFSVYDSLRHTAWQSDHRYLNRLDHEQLQSLRQDDGLVYHFLQTAFDPDGAKSAVIFKSGNQLAKVFVLNIPGWDYYAIDAHPYILPLAAMTQEQPRIILLHLQQDQAVFYRYRQGRLEELEKVSSSVPDVSVTAGRDDKTQLYNYDQLHRHFVKVQAKLDNLGKRYKGARLIISGDDRSTASFKNNVLPRQWQGQLIAILPYSPGQAAADWLGPICEELEAIAEKTEDQYADILSHAQGLGQLTPGLPPSLQAQNDGLIRLLAVDPSLKQPGAICPVHHYLSMEGGQCPTCQASLLPVDNIVDTLVGQAEKYDVDLKIFTRHPEKLSTYGGVAAVKQAAISG